MSAFRICITRENGNAVLLYPGSQGERDLVDAVVVRLLHKNVGYFVSQVQVAQLVRESLCETLHALKAEVIPF